MNSIYFIIEISDSSRYGIGTYLHQVLKALEKTSFRVNVVSLGDNGVNEIAVRVENGIRHIQIPSSSYRGIIGQTMLERWERNLFYVIIPYVSMEDKNIFHFNSYSLYWFALKLKQNLDCRILLTVHYQGWCLDLLGDRQRLQETLNALECDTVTSHVKDSVYKESRFINEIADHVIAVSESSRDNLLSVYRVDPLKISLIPHSVKYENFNYPDVDKWQERERLHVTKEEMLIVFAGRLEIIKGLEYLQAAFIELLQEDKDLRLVICGSGNYDYFLKTSTPVWNKITFTGRIAREELYRLYAIADIGVVPSFHEEFGYVALEMLMSGLPVIANKTSGLRDLLGNERFGLYFEIDKKSFSRTVKDLKAKMKLLLYDRTVREKYRQNIQEVRLMYGIEAQKAKLTGLYESLMKSFEVEDIMT